MRKPEEIQEEIERLGAANIKRMAAVRRAREKIAELIELKSKAVYADDLKNGIDVNVIKITGEWPHFLMETDEGFKWYCREPKPKTGPNRITKRFYEQIKEAYERRDKETY